MINIYHNITSSSTQCGGAGWGHVLAFVLIAFSHKSSYCPKVRSSQTADRVVRSFSTIVSLCVCVLAQRRAATVLRPFLLHPLPVLLLSLILYRPLHRSLPSGFFFVLSVISRGSRRAAD